MSPNTRRLAAAAASVVLILSGSPLGPISVARAGADLGSPPAPNAFGADTIGILAAPGDVVDHIGIVWDEIIHPDFLPVTDDFTVTLNGAPVLGEPTDVTSLYSGLADDDFLGSPGGFTFMRLGLGFIWTAGTDVLTLSYDPVGEPVRDFALNETQPFTELPVEPWDFVDLFVIGPAIDESHGRDRILVGITMPVEPDLPAPGDFAVDIDGDPVLVTGVTQLFADIGMGIGMGILDLQLAAPIDDPEASVTLVYTRGANPITSARDGAELDPFSLPVLLLLTSDTASDPALAPGGTLSTATPDGVTAADPVATSVTSPTGGAVSISEGPITVPSSSGYEFFGQQVEITAPDATAATPIAIRFDLDASLVPAGQTAETIQIFRNGILVPDCTGATGVADPDPCISERTALLDGDVSITVLTSQASTWNMAVAVPFAFGGLQPPVNGDEPNGANAGSAIPVKFSLGGFRGLDIFADGSPWVGLISCATLGEADEIEQTVTAGESSLTYDEATDTYTYVWKTLRGWRDTCRRLVLDFADGSQATAIFDFRR